MRPSYQQKNHAFPLWVVVSIYACLSVAKGQTVIHVPADHPTIRAAIDAAVNGDTVLVAPGTYKENINFNGKAITVTSSGGPQVTIIDGGQAGAVVTFSTGETSSSVLSGFTLQNGFANLRGGGIAIGGASPKITGNAIVNNTGCDGLGIAVSGGSPLIQGNVISNNTRTNCSGGNGGGGILAFSPAQIIGNVISNNNVLEGGNGGGGITLFGAGAATIRSNVIFGNTVTGVSPASQGGGMWIANGTGALIIQNLIIGNHTDQGGGIYWSNPPAELLNNTIADNDAPLGSGVFGGSLDNTVRVTNNLIVAKSGQLAFGCGSFNSTTPPVFTSNDVFSPQGTAYGTGCVDQTGTNGNISTDPLFVAPLSSNYLLQSGSPAIDVGDNTAPNLPPKDIDGDNRIINATGKPTAIVDMGVDEFSNAEVLTLSASSLTYGTQGVGTSSAAQSVTFTNHGTVTANISAVLTGGDFSQTNTCGTGLAAAANCSVSVTFTPTVTGTRNGVMAIMTDASESPQVVFLSGGATGPVVSLSTTFLSFNAQVMGTTSPAQPVTLTNTGDGPLTFTSIVTSGDFAETDNCPVSPATLAAGAFCTLNLTFTPTAIGLRTGTVTITDNAPGSPQTIQLSGQGLSLGVVSFSAPSLTFPNTLVGTTSAAQTLTLTNTGTGPLAISSILTTFDYAQTNNCPVSPPPWRRGQIAPSMSPLRRRFPARITGRSK